MVSTKGVGSASAPNDDSDLEDLIAKSPRGRHKSNVEIDSSDAPSSGGGGFMSVTPLGFMCGACRLFHYQCPCLSKCVFSLLFGAFLAFLMNTVFNPTQETGIMGADYSAITSAYDLSLSKVHHWCIQGDNDSCKCEDPLEPTSRSEFKSWNAAHKSNVADVNLYRAVYGSKPTMIDEATGKPRPPIDVAFLGESVVEAMDGRWLGKRVVKALGTRNGREGMEARKKPDIGKVFERLYRKEKGGPVEGVALGIAGDNTANVLWRLQHDEMPYDFNPKVWWLVLGMNDLTRMQCSEEIVVLGILRVVEEIRLRKPDAKIVINSLLPMINYQRNDQPKMADFADFRAEGKNSMRAGMETNRLKEIFKENSAGMDALKQKGFRDGGNGPRKLRSPKKKSLKKSKKRHGRHQDEDDATEGPALEEALERRKKILEARDKRIRDKIFKDKEKYHPKKPLSPLLPVIRKHVLPPVWPSVHLINDKLKEFCTKHESITFFDATHIFATNEGGGRHHLQNELISPRGHPSELGFAIWEGQIMGQLHKMITKKAEKEKRESPPQTGDITEKVGKGKSETQPDSTDGLDKDEDHPEIEVLSPVTKVSKVSTGLDEGDDAERSGDGSEHVSEGKESGPPPKVEQPSRSAPAQDKKNGQSKDNKRVRAKDEPSDLAKAKRPELAEDEEGAPAKDKKRVPAKVKESTPAKDKERAPARVKESEPVKDKKRAPVVDTPRAPVKEQNKLPKGKKKRDNVEEESASAQEEEEDKDSGDGGDGDAAETEEGDSEDDEKGDAEDDDKGDEDDEVEEEE